MTGTQPIALEDVRSAIDWSIKRVREDHPPGTSRFPSSTYELAEHFFGMYSIGYTMTVCDDTVGGLRANLDGLTPERLEQIKAGAWPYASMDYDARCSCCGVVAMGGCEDIYHGKEDEAAARIFAKIQAFEPDCSCHRGF